MSLLIPVQRDHVDAHADLEQDDVYHTHLSKAKAEEYPWAFSTVDSFFTQSSDDTNDMEFNYAVADFGALEPWDVMRERLDTLNRSSDSAVYKLLFLARHGEGWHNIAYGKYPKSEWISKWKYLGTDGEIEYGPDAKLTPLGIAQAKENRDCWNDQILKGAPIPGSFYVSPLSRSLSTLQHTWESQKTPTPLVVEHLRETIGVHLCHTRSTKSEIKEKYPFVVFEPGFSETDELAVHYADNREQLHQQFLRVNGVLQKIFNEDEEPVISITCHAGTIRSFITVIGHRKFTIPTGGMIPVVVKGMKKV